MLNIFEYKDYRLFITDYLKEKQLTNKAFSLRALAKKLDISPGHLSHVLTGRKNLSSDHTEIICQSFKFTPQEKIFFELLVEYAHGSPKIKSSILKKITIERSKSLIVEEDMTEALSKINWQHMLLLISVKIKASTENLINFATSEIGLKAEQTKEYLAELTHLGFLKDSKGQLQRTSKRLIFTSKGPNPTLKRMHIDYLKKSEEFVKTRSTEDRFSVTEFITIPHDKFDEAKRITNEYLDELATLSEAKNDDVIGITLHLNRFQK